MWGRFCPSGESGWGAWAPQTKDLSSKPPAQKPIFELVNLPPASFVRPGHFIGKRRHGRLQELVNPRNWEKIVGFFLARDPNFPHIFRGVCSILGVPNRRFRQSWARRPVSGAPIGTPRPAS